MHYHAPSQIWDGKAPGNIFAKARQATQCPHLISFRDKGPVPTVLIVLTGRDIFVLQDSRSAPVTEAPVANL
jgi:hypothetical protein